MLVENLNLMMLIKLCVIIWRWRVVHELRVIYGKHWIAAASYPIPVIVTVFTVTVDENEVTSTKLSTVLN